MSEQTYTISELAREAGVTVRTIRYYISQGLLPSPGMAGQSDRYDESYLKRLELIRRLKAEYLPLERIRELLDTLGEEAIKEEVDAAPQPEPEPDSAKRYLQALLVPARSVTLNQRLEKRLSQLQMDLDRDVNSPMVSFHRMAIPAPVPRSQDTSPTEQTWVRYRICDDVELHVRAQPSNQELKHRLAAMIKELERLCRS